MSTLKIPCLDARLSAAVSYVRHGGVCADIGCDHGKLSTYLAAKQICRFVIACDMRVEPLNKAKKTAQLTGLTTEIDFRLGNGLQVIQPQEVDDIIIAGMSGITISKILTASPSFWQPHFRFIFIPATKDGELRSFLAQHGFSILQETPCIAAKRVYTVMHVQYTEFCWQPSLKECAIGKAANQKTTAAAAYLQHTANTCRKYARGTNQTLQQQLYQLATELEQEVLSWNLSQLTK